MQTVLIAIIVALVLVFIGYIIYQNRNRFFGREREIAHENIDVLVKYVKARQEEEEQRRSLKELKAAEMKQKLDNFKRTKDELKEQLRCQLGRKEWLPLSSILSKADKGGMGIYVLYNETKGKYYVGQSKEIFARIKKHFEIEPIARDYCGGDLIKVKFIGASELCADYRIDHVEKTGIELFEASKTGYNKTSGNL